MTQSMVTIEGLTDLANDLIIQNAAIRNRLDAAEKQRDELLEALELLIDDLALRAKLRGDDCLDVSDGRLYKAQKAIAKAKGE
jgi:hypothetical protein